MPQSAGRRWTIRVLLVTGTVLAFLSIFAIWANRQVLNEDHWADTSSALLANKAVQKQVAGFLVDEVYANVDVAGEIRAAAPPRLAPLAGPAAGALRNLAEKTTQTLLGRPRVQEAWVIANRAAARQFIAIAKGDSRVVTLTGDTVFLNLHPLVVDLVNRLGLPGTLIGKVPPSAGRLAILKADQISLLQDGAKAIQGLAILLPALALICFGVAVFLARGRRHRILLWTGVDLILAGVVALLARTLMGNAVVDTLATTESVRPTTEAVWTIGTDLLKDVARACIVLGIPVVLGALAAGDTRPAVELRRLAAPTMRDRPAVVYLVEAVVVLLVVWWGPIPATRNPVPLLVLVVLLTIGVEGLRRQTVNEFPPDDGDAARSALIERARRAGQAVAGRGRFDQRPGEPVPPPPPAPSHVPEDVVDRLERLEALHDRGVLTDDEFASQKSAALSA